MKSVLCRILPALAGLFGLVACVSKVYQPGPADSPLHRLKLGESYGDMVRVLGTPDSSRAEDRSGEETALLFVPGWNLVESAGDMNPSSIQVYTYDRWGTVTIGNNRIIRIEGNQPSASTSTNNTPNATARKTAL